MYLSLKHIPQTLIFCAFAAILCSPTVAAAQDRFNISLNFGQTRGLTSYRNDIVYVENSATIDPDPAAGGKALYKPYLADENYNWGTLAGLQLNFGNIDIELQAQWFERDSITIHHDSEDLLPRRRLRSDNTVDDRGATYRELDTPIEQNTVSRGRGDLLLVSLMGGWRFQQVYNRLSMYLPVGGGLVVAHIDEPNHPYVVGAQVYTGAGLSFQMAKNFSLSAVARIFALGTFEYDRVDDASRHAQATNSSTADAFFSSMIHTGLHVGLVYIVR